MRIPRIKLFTSLFALLTLSALSAPAVMPNIFATQPAGNVQASTLDTNFTFLENQGVQGLATTGSSNTYVLTPPDAWLTSYSQYVGRALTVVPNFGNTGAATFNVSGLGAASIYKNVNGTQTALSSGDIVSGTPAILVCDGTGFLLANPTFTSSSLPVGGYLNKFRNAQMAVWQHGTSGTFTAGSPSYGPDGWIGVATTQNESWSQGTTYTLFNGQVASNYLHIAGVGVGAQDFILKQRIESLDAASLASQQVTAQCTFTNTTGITLAPKITVKHPTIANNYGATVTDVNAVALQSAGGGGNFTVAAYTFAAAANTINGLEVSFDFGAISNTHSIDITGCDIRATPGLPTGINTSPPPVELLTLANEMPRDQRFFWKSFKQGVAPATNVGTGNGELEFAALRAGTNPEWLNTIVYPAVMQCAAPTITIYNPSAANNQIRDVTQTADLTSSSAALTADSNFAITGTGVAGTAVGDLLLANVTSSCEL